MTDRDLIARLVKALDKLSNEVLGSLPLMEELCRREFGITNYKILIQRAHEARSVLDEVRAAMEDRTVCAHGISLSASCEWCEDSYGSGRAMPMNAGEAPEPSTLAAGITAGASASRRGGPAPDDGWQDIASAPKDQREIMIGHWDLKYDNKGGHCHWFTKAHWNLFRAAWMDGITEQRWMPTHWRPLPPPPAD